MHAWLRSYEETVDLIVKAASKKPVTSKKKQVSS